MKEVITFAITSFAASVILAKVTKLKAKGA